MVVVVVVVVVVDSFGSVVVVGAGRPVIRKGGGLIDTSTIPIEGAAARLLAWVSVLAYDDTAASDQFPTVTIQRDRGIATS